MPFSYKQMLCDLEQSFKLEKASYFLICHSAGHQAPAPPKPWPSSVSPGLTSPLPSLLPLESKIPLKALHGQSCGSWELLPHPADARALLISQRSGPPKETSTFENYKLIKNYKQIELTPGNRASVCPIDTPMLQWMLTDQQPGIPRTVFRVVGAEGRHASKRLCPIKNNRPWKRNLSPEQIRICKAAKLHNYRHNVLKIGHVPAQAARAWHPSTALPRVAVLRGAVVPSQVDR